jgi:DNA polymerase III epsilon subunit-like protein
MSAGSQPTSDEDVVAGSPTFAMLADTLISRLSGRIIVTHTAFDRVAVHQAGTKYKIPPLSCTWLDTACVARRAWTEFSRRGYGLASICASIGYNFNHHDALEDANAVERHIYPVEMVLRIDVSFPLLRQRAALKLSDANLTDRCHVRIRGLDIDSNKHHLSPPSDCSLKAGAYHRRNAPRFTPPAGLRSGRSMVWGSNRQDCPRD